MELDLQESPGEIKRVQERSRESRGDQESPGEIKRVQERSRESRRDQESPGEIKSREVELDSQELSLIHI